MISNNRRYGALSVNSQSFKMLNGFNEYVLRGMVELIWQSQVWQPLVTGDSLYAQNALDQQCRDGMTFREALANQCMCKARKKISGQCIDGRVFSVRSINNARTDRQKFWLLSLNFITSSFLSDDYAVLERCCLKTSRQRKSVSVQNQITVTDEYWGLKFVFPFWRIQNSGPELSLQD